MSTALALVALAVGIYAVIIYNGFVRDRNRVLSAWSDIDVQLKRRHDLLPKLVEAVRRYAQYERATLESIAQLRARSERAHEVSEIGALEGALGAGVRRLFALVEDYPELKADAGFLDLQRNVTEVEEHIQFARRYYNGAVLALNTRVDSFPDLLIARLFAFRVAQYFELDDPAQASVPAVI